MNSDYIYWTFSAASQSISAFVALLIAGYALVHTLMEAVRERDDSLEEVHAELRFRYHTRLRELAWVTGAAISLSLLVVFFNRSDVPTPRLALLLVAALDLAAVVGGLAFVVSIIDPRKYEKAAGKVLESIPQVSASSTSASEFFDAFLHLERLIRDYLRSGDLYVPSRGAPRMSYSFRQMIEALLQNERIDRYTFDELLAINKYRNLVFHGHVDRADADMLNRVRAASSNLEASLR